MLTNLIESKRKKKRTVAGTFSSVIIHAAIIFFAVVATANAREARAFKPKAEDVKFVEVKKEEPKPEPEKPEPEPPKPKAAPERAPEPTVAPPPRVEAPAPPRGFQVLTAPVNIPVKIPDIDLSRAVTSAADFSGKGVAGGTSGGREGGTPGGTGTATGGIDIAPKAVYREEEVEVEASVVSGADPAYPEQLRESGIEGRVLVQFVVNENGRVQPGSVRVMESAHPLFTAAVRSALANMRFSPAKVGGRAVKQYVQQPFSFRLTKS